MTLSRSIPISHWKASSAVVLRLDLPAGSYAVSVGGTLAAAATAIAGKPTLIALDVGASATSDVIVRAASATCTGVGGATGGGGAGGTSGVGGTSGSGTSGTGAGAESGASVGGNGSPIGTAGSSGTGVANGAATNGGNAPAGGAGAVTAGASKGSSGCGCRTARGSSNAGVVFAVAGLALALARRRKLRVSAARP